MNDYPIILAHGIARFDFLLEYLVQNSKLFNIKISDLVDGLSYFKGITQFLRRKGFDAEHSNVAFADGVKKRSEDLQNEVELFLNIKGKQKAHIIAHSMGGLDARLMIVNNKNGIADRISSLTTIGTPHNGTYLADYWLEKGGDEVITALEKCIRLNGFADLTTKVCGDFNTASEKIEADNSVVYQTIATKENRKFVFFPLQGAWEKIFEKQGDNDGLVPVSSQLWTDEIVGDKQTKVIHHLGFPMDADHLNQVGWWDPNQLLAHNHLIFLLAVEIAKYEQEIKEAYLKTAERLKQLPA